MAATSGAPVTLHYTPHPLPYGALSLEIPPLVPEISDGLLAGLLIVPMLAFIILAHEFGHFFAARSVGIKVEEFGLGIPPRAKGWTWRGVLWSLNWIPLGGFVRVKGEDGRDMEPGSMNTKGPASRAFFLLAGSGANFVAAALLSIMLVAAQGVPNETSQIYIQQVEPNSPAAEAGWQPADAIVAIAGEPIDGLAEFSAALDRYAGQEMPVVIERGDQRIATTVTPREDPPAGQGATGIRIGEAYLSSIQIGEVSPGSPAAEAGWQEGDEIVAIDGVEIESVAQVNALLSNAAGGVTEVTMLRGGELVETMISLEQPAIEITAVGPDSPASEALLYPGDRLVSIGGMETADPMSLFLALEDAAGGEVPVVVEREGREVELTLAVPEYDEGENPLAVIGANAMTPTWQSQAGVSTQSSRDFVAVDASETIPRGLDQFWFIVTGTLEGIGQLFTAPDTGNLAGPVGMGQLTSEFIAESSMPVWFIVGNLVMVISVGLGLLNLMPLPALDGGRLAFVVLEVLRGGKRLPPEKEGLVHLAGLALLLMLMFFVAFNDVTRIIDGEQILP
ncbi:MAG TPA: site-2 protease family protein [Thermomicrobiales bacterium]|nr:site-2 protease family protein [Thermomicrobiales bacterium]